MEIVEAESTGSGCFETESCMNAIGRKAHADFRPAGGHRNFRKASKLSNTNPNPSNPNPSNPNPSNFYLLPPPK